MQVYNASIFVGTFTFVERTNNVQIFRFIVAELGFACAATRRRVSSANERGRTQRNYFLDNDHFRLHLRILLIAIVFCHTNNTHTLLSDCRAPSCLSWSCCWLPVGQQLLGLMFSLDSARRMLSYSQLVAEELVVLQLWIDLVL